MIDNLFVGLVLLAASTAAAGDSVTAATRAAVTVETRSGPITGQEEGSVVSFRGIPYAKPPVGELRFLAPAPFPAWADTLGPRGLDASRFGASCVQPEAAPWLTEQNEDCLTLNVWTRRNALRDRGRRRDRDHHEERDGKHPSESHGQRDEDRHPDRHGLPVMVFIHGGGWTNEGSSDAWYDGAKLARRGVVVVTLNYRLGAFGFLHLDELADAAAADAGAGNAGILDQIAALGWVRNHIAPFGGDPENVTIFGESAGSMSVAVLMATPDATGLFHRAIAESGALNTVRTAAHATAVTRRLLQLAGVDSVAELRSLSTEALARANHDIVYGVWFSDTLFGPVVDHVLLHEPPLDSIANGSADGIDLLIGTTEDEIRYYAYLEPLVALIDPWVVIHLSSYLVDLFGGRTGGEPTLTANFEAALASYQSRRPGSTRIDAGLALATDVFFRIPSIRLAEAQRRHDSDVWMWRFDWDSPIGGGIYGAMHGVELPFVFGNLAAATDFIGDTPPKRLVRTVQRAWISFARDGNPNSHGLPTWPRYGDRRETMLIDLKPRLVEDPDGEDRAYWEGVAFDGLSPTTFDIR